MTDFSKMVFEERAVGDGMREIRIVAPAHPTIVMPDRQFLGIDARKKLLRYIMANAAGLAPHLADELEAVTAAIHADIDDEELQRG